jgi:hypothetical protein
MDPRWIKKLEVFGANDEKLFDVKGPCCICTCGCNNLFVVRFPTSGSGLGPWSKI